MVGKKKEGILMVYNMAFSGTGLWDAYEYCRKKGIDVGSWGNALRSYAAWKEDKIQEVKAAAAAAASTPASKGTTRKRADASAEQRQRPSARARQAVRS